MRKMFHDRLSSGSLNYIDVDAWSKNKIMIHPKRTAADTNRSQIIGEACLSRELP